jgi:hypothetical protein
VEATPKFSIPGQLLSSFRTRMPSRCFAGSDAQVLADPPHPLSARSCTSSPRPNTRPGGPSEWPATRTPFESNQSAAGSRHLEAVAVDLKRTALEVRLPAIGSRLPHLRTARSRAPSTSSTSRSRARCTPSCISALRDDSREPNRCCDEKSRSRTNLRNVVAVRGCHDNAALLNPHKATGEAHSHLVAGSP